MHEHFLEEDLPKAYKEEKCAFDLSIVAQNALIRNDYYKVEQYLIDMLKSVNELKRMNDKKIFEEILDDHLAYLLSKGIAINAIEEAFSNE